MRNRGALGVELGLSVDVRAIRGELDVPGHGEAVLEANRRAVIEPEEVAHLLAKGPVAKIPLESMRQAEVRFVPRQPERRRKVNQRKVWLGRLRSGVIGLNGRHRLREQLAGTGHVEERATQEEGNPAETSRHAANCQCNAQTSWKRAIFDVLMVYPYALRKRLRRLRRRDNFVHRTFVRVLAAVVAGLALWSCGGGSSSSPSVTSDPSTASITITMTSTGVSPNPIRVSPGTRVRFLNNDSRQHEMTSDPHPAHTDCVEINQVGLISTGQTKETGNLNAVKTCGYHDHQNPDDRNFQGRIIIQ